jgi:hypothetical protein
MIYAPQGTDAGRMLRSFTRRAWRELYRFERIALREHAKAFSDMVVFGSGFVKIAADGLPAHAPVCEVYRTPPIPVSARLPVDHPRPTINA